MKVVISSLQVQSAGSKGHFNPALRLAIAFKQAEHDVAILPLPCPLSDDEKALLTNEGIVYLTPPPLPNNIPKPISELTTVAKNPATMHLAYDSFLLEPIPHQLDKLTHSIQQYQPTIIIFDALVYPAAAIAEHLNIPSIGYCAGLKLNADQVLTKNYANVAKRLSDKRRNIIKTNLPFHELEILSDQLNVIFTPNGLLPHTRAKNVGPLHTPLPNNNPTIATDILLTFGSAIDPIQFEGLVHNIKIAADRLQKKLTILSKKRVINLPESLKQTNCIIHHGGANIFAESCLAGCPQLIIPLMNDQPVQADILQRTGAGRTLSPSKATADAITSALAELLDVTQPIHKEVAVMAKKFQENDGATALIQMSEKLGETHAHATN